jgi:cytochrome d ubiquinol oxidase subunit I
VATTLVLFVLVYAIVFAMGIYYINRLITRGPKEPGPEPDVHGPPLAAAMAGGGNFVDAER